MLLRRCEAGTLEDGGGESLIRVFESESVKGDGDDGGLSVVCFSESM